MSTVAPYCVGITGGIGSGKSAVAERFSALGVQVIDTDCIAHALTAPDGAAMPAIVNAFGAEMATQTGALNRVLMRKRIFSDVAAREKLEAILHPLIRVESLRSLLALKCPYALLVVPLLLENWAAYRPMLNRVLLVESDEALQLVRTAARPGLDIEQARAILATQADQNSRRAIADDLIDNRQDFIYLDAQVVRLHAHYLNLAGLISHPT